MDTADDYLTAVMGKVSMDTADDYLTAVMGKVSMDTADDYLTAVMGKVSIKKKKRSFMQPPSPPRKLRGISVSGCSHCAVVVLVTYVRVPKGKKSLTLGHLKGMSNR